jgi:WD40 repeat protein
MYFLTDDGKREETYLGTWCFNGKMFREGERVKCAGGVLSPRKDRFAFEVLEKTSANHNQLQLFVQSLETGQRKHFGTLPYSVERYEFTSCGRYLTTNSFALRKEPTFIDKWTGRVKQLFHKPSEQISKAEDIEQLTRDQDLRLWDLEQGQQIVALPGYFSMGFSPDGKTLATIDPTHSVHFWDVPPRRPWLPILGYAALPAALMGICGWWRTRRRTKRAAQA